ncbi:sugar phosphate isomerase/epimerase [Sphingobium sufflavum]|uniref:sugar phosphate isomerase/epimerase family protein n=1 Tax=Sphingobium sufflavum TaxID=1129547 RepID=UPI001F242B35|nr:TIM barrel protein [Sphingobium sufflavum]MCE7798828.1 sugar phosphate isomerase/epimerase [Sphingobium sufflavum]
MDNRLGANRLGIELLSVLGMPPVAHVRLAADLGCAYISTGLTGMPDPFNPHGFAPWSLRDDPALRREMAAALRDTGVRISLGEGLGVRPGVAMADRAGDLDIFAELGARGVGGVSMDRDRARTVEEFATLVDLATARGLKATIEFAPAQAVSSLEDALAVVDAVASPHFRVLIDAMHFFRSGGTVERLRALDPDQIGYAQLCDVPLVGRGDYMEEAMSARMAPGQGALPLADFIAALPADIPLGLEIPRIADALAGIDARAILAPAVAAARSLGA